MKKIFVLLVILLLISCNEEYEMNKIESLTSTVTTSLTVIDEEQALEQVWEYISNNRIYVEILSTDQSGNVVDINEVDDLGSIVKVSAIFSKGKNSKKVEWKPIKIDNVFILFREK